MSLEQNQGNQQRKWISTTQHRIDHLITQNRLQDINTTHIDSSLTKLKYNRFEMAYNVISLKENHVDYNLSSFHYEFLSLYNNIMKDIQMSYASNQVKMNQLTMLFKETREIKKQPQNNP